MLEDWRRKSGPRERLIRGGEGQLSERELLAILLGTGNARDNVEVVAGTLLAHFKTLRGLARATPGELMRTAGVGPAKAARIKAGLELAVRMAAEARGDRPGFSHSKDVFEYVHLKLRDLQHEVFETLLLDAKNRLVRHCRISAGTLTGSLVHPREVFRPAVTEGAAGIVLLHNHPSGDPTPSVEDLEVTMRLVSAGELLGISVLDHVVVGDGRYVSMADDGTLRTGVEDGVARGTSGRRHA